VARTIIQHILKTYEVIGYPRLVRLNPNIPWKTRGNGALCLQIGQRGSSQKQRIGSVDGQEIYCSRTLTQELDDVQQRDLASIVNSVVDEQAKLDEENTNPGYVLLSKKPGMDLYKKAVTTIVRFDDVQAILQHHHAVFKGYKNGRGLIGATAAVAWEPTDRTYELIAYRQQERWGTKRKVDQASVQHMDTMCQSTFDNYDARNHHNRIVPNSPCPILYGIRGDDAKELMTARTLVKSEPMDSWLVFETNQGTDDHLQRKSIEHIQPFESVITEGSVDKNPWSIQGGHVLFTIQDTTGTTTCAAYEPTKEFRNVIRGLYSGDLVEVYGGVREQPLTINLEKLLVKRLISIKEKTENPICPTCGKHMKSKGTNQGYKCIRCKTTTAFATVHNKPRTITQDFYEVPVCARRHLSKPLKRIT
jgi:tRNA(Ile2)-agmatinylcytidine synthase